MTRELPEWIGKTDDSRPPRRVRARVFEDHGGICYLSNRRIMAGEKWDLDHITALCNGGENRESNLAPALRDKHKIKTGVDVAEKSKVARVRAKHLGIRATKRNPMPGSKASGFRKKMDGTVERRS